jgi:hypothetical protein
VTPANRAAAALRRAVTYAVVAWEIARGLPHRAARKHAADLKTAALTTRTRRRQ